MKTIINNNIEYNIIYPDDSFPSGYLEEISDMCYQLDIDDIRYQVEKVDINNIEKVKANRILNNRDFEKKIFIIPTIDSKIIGMLNIYKSYLSKITPHDYYDINTKYGGQISQFFIKKEYRGIGIGTTMIKIAEDYFKNDKRVDKIEVDTQFKNPARHLYEKLNYQIYYYLLSSSVSNTNVSMPNILYTLNNNIILERLTQKSILNKIQYLDNRYGFMQIMNYIKRKLFNREFMIFDFGDDVYAFIGLWPEAQLLNILDIVTDQDIDLLLINKIIKGINAYAINNNIEYLRMYINNNDNLLNLLKKVNFKENMVIYFKDNYQT